MTTCPASVAVIIELCPLHSRATAKTMPTHCPSCDVKMAYAPGMSSTTVPELYSAAAATMRMAALTATAARQ